MRELNNNSNDDECVGGEKVEVYQLSLPDLDEISAICITRDDTDKSYNWLVEFVVLLILVLFRISILFNKILPYKNL